MAANKYEYVQYCSILLGAKFFQDEEQILVNVKDRGGLWKVNNDAQNILNVTEKMFRRATKNFVFKVNEVKLISEAVQDTKLRSYYDNLCQNAESSVDKETSVNLLEQILGLFIRVRSYSYALDVKEEHKANYSKVKMHSLRTELKKSSKQ